MVQDRDKKGNGATQDKSKITCFNCDKTGHYKNECKQPVKEEGKRQVKGAEDNKPAAANDSNSEADKIRELVKKAPKLEKPDEPNELKYNGKVCAKWCDKCKCYTWGDKMHAMAEHKSKPEAAAAMGQQVPYVNRFEQLSDETDAVSAECSYDQEESEDDESVGSAYRSFMAVVPVDVCLKAEHGWP